MAQVSFDKMMPLVAPHVPGCPNAVIATHLAEAAAKFCEESQVWKFTTDSENTSANEADYALSLPSNSVIEDILQLKLNDKLLERTSDDHQELSDDVSAPSAYAIYNDNVVRLYPTPDAAYSFRAKVILKPSSRAKGIEDFLYESHRRVISYCALAELLIMPDKEWTNPGLASFYESKFTEGVDEAESREFRKVKRRNKSYFF